MKNIPLDYAKVNKKLDEKKKDFLKFNLNAEEELKVLKEFAQKSFKLDYDALIKKLENANFKGALPSKEYIHGLLVEFPVKFQNLQEMMSWAKDNIRNKIVVGSDGSQIYQASELTVPIAVVQAVRYCNEHSLKAKSYSEKREIEVLTPNELMYIDEEENQGSSQEPVDAKRFELEMKLLVSAMQDFHNQKISNEDILLISDGSLVLSFLLKIGPAAKKVQFAALADAIAHSKLYKYPLVGYIDSSAAKDVVNMLSFANGAKLPSHMENAIDENEETEDFSQNVIPQNSNENESMVKFITDAYVLEHYITSKDGLNHEMHWGDRTCAFICERNDIIYKQYPEKIKSKIAFFYIKLSSSILARVEFPEWCLEQQGMVENIANIMRAESVIGSGYPYTLDQCHNRTVIHGDERIKFLRLFQDFGNKNGIKVKIKNKSRSKMVRS